jgi:hypothetical protein
MFKRFVLLALLATPAAADSEVTYRYIGQAHARKVVCDPRKPEMPMQVTTLKRLYDNPACTDACRQAVHAHVEAFQAGLMDIKESAAKGQVQCPRVFYVPSME